MPVATLQQLKDQLAFTDDIGTADDALLQGKLDAAQRHVERLLGFRIEATFGGADQDPIPEDLVEAVIQLAAWWYENREAAAERVRETPFGVREIVTEYRDWTF